MKTKIMSVVALVGITLSMTAVVGTLGVIALIPNEAAAQEQKPQEEQEFDALLAGSFEVPPVNTSGSGFGELGVVDNGNTVEYKVTVINMENVTKAHIHLGNSSQAGPIVASLLNASTPTGPIIGELTEGNITSADLMGPLQGKPLSDLITLMQNGTAYVNVHTVQNPDGEIRGAIVLDTD